MSENVLVVHRRLFDKVGSFQGICLGVADYLGAMWGSSDIFFHPREKAETDFFLKQIIPYVLVECNGKILRYRRDKEGERRLEGFYSIGIGGHINTTDGAINECYFNGLARELREEIGFNITENSTLPRVSAIVNDDNTEVGAVHLGMVHVLRFRDAIPRIPNLSLPEWVPTNELLKEKVSAYEPWSKICLLKLPLLLCQQVDLGDRGLVPAEIIRESDIPGMCVCQTSDGKRITVHQQQLR